MVVIKVGPNDNKVLIYDEEPKEQDVFSTVIIFTRSDPKDPFKKFQDVPKNPNLMIDKCQYKSNKSKETLLQPTQIRSYPKSDLKSREVVVSNYKLFR